MCTYLNPHVVSVFILVNGIAAFGQTYAIFRLQMDLTPCPTIIATLGCVVTKFGFKFIPSVNPVSTPVTSKAYSDYLIKIIEYFIEVHFLILDWNEQAAVRKHFANVGKRLLTCFNA
jgi:xanthosine utilization system XapX-like protein